MFQLFSHKDLYDDNHPDIFKSTKYQGPLLRRRAQTTPAAESSVPLNRITSGSLTGSPPSSPSTAHRDLHLDPEDAPVSPPKCEEEEEETPQMSVGLTIGLLVVVTVVSLVLQLGLLILLTESADRRLVRSPNRSLQLPRSGLSTPLMV